jgi:hypothetical protein
MLRVEALQHLRIQLVHSGSRSWRALVRLCQVDVTVFCGDQVRIAMAVGMRGVVERELRLGPVESPIGLLVTHDQPHVVPIVDRHVGCKLK